jgi:hypothetical protein
MYKNTPWLVEGGNQLRSVRIIARVFPERK